MDNIAKEPLNIDIIWYYKIKNKRTVTHEAQILACHYKKKK